MQKLSTFCRTLAQSWTNPTYYARVLKARFSFSLKYFSFFLFLLGILLTLRIAIPVSLFNLSGMLKRISLAYPAELQVRVDRGHVTINQATPYVIPLPAEIKNTRQSFGESPIDNAVVFLSDQDLRGVADFYAAHSWVVVTETSIYTRKNTQTQEVAVYPVPTTKQPIEISQQLLQAGLDRFLAHPFIQYKLYAVVIGTLAFIVLTPIMFVARFLMVLVFSAILFVIAKFFEKSWMRGYHFSYKQVVQISLHTITLVLIISTLLSFLPGFFRLPSGAGFVIYMLFSLYVMSKSSQFLTKPRKKPAASTRTRK